MASLSEFPAETRMSSAAKITVLALAYCLVVQNYASYIVVGLAGMSFILGAIASRYLVTKPLTTFGALLLSSSWLISFYLLSECFDSYGAVGELWNAKTLIQIVDTCRFVGLGGASAFTLRFLSYRFRYGGIGEIVFSMTAASALLVEHRNHALDRPRFLADWALIQGLNPYDLILAAGILALVLTMILALRQRFTRSVVLGIMILLLASGVAFWFRDHIEVKSSLDDLLSSQSDKSDKGNGGASDRLSRNEPPQPVAVALLHSEFRSPDYILHFRQQALSFYDGTRFSTEPVPRFDTDLIQDFPGQTPQTRPDNTEPGYRTQVDASMFLLTNHPQPFALSNASAITQRPNPSPRRFVAAYDATSRVLHVPIKRLLGRASVPASWSDEKRKHYLTGPEDPRFKSLAQELAEEVDLRHHGDVILSSLAVKRYLEKNGYYTLSEKHLGAKDPAASFLFGNLKGYCVHFAHSAVALLRSLGVASRVALGYAVDLRARGEGSALVIMGDTAHAWPEIHIEGIGWIPFDIYPERSDEPPTELVQQSLESIFGELARDDAVNSELVSAARRTWYARLRVYGKALLLTLLGLLFCLYGGLFIRRLYLRRTHASVRQQYRFALDALSDLGYRRQPEETRIEFAERLNNICPSILAMTRTFQSHVYGNNEVSDAIAHRTLMKQFTTEVKTTTPFYLRLYAFLNPIGWLRTR
ncbi:MAG: DUF4129 domain-containing transglutaminase family protein [Bradymonadia bacterium]